VKLWRSQEMWILICASVRRPRSPREGKPREVNSHKIPKISPEPVKSQSRTSEINLANLAHLLISPFTRLGTCRSLLAKRVILSDSSFESRQCNDQQRTTNNEITTHRLRRQELKGTHRYADSGGVNVLGAGKIGLGYKV
jgi:hypothetical protein